MQRLVKAAGVGLFGLTLAGSPTLAQRPARCQPVPNRAFEVLVRIEVPPPKLDRSQSREQLSGFSPHGPNRQVLGQTRYRLELRQATSYVYRQEGTGVCVWIETVNINLHYPALEVFVAREYAASSCAYRAILAHENKHADIARARVDRYAPKFRLALDSLKIPSGRAPMAAASLEEAKRQVDAELARLLEPPYQQLIAETARAQAAIDTPDAYAQVKRQCDDW